MFASRLAGATTFMIYLGTLLLSILSFYTTYKGLAIVIDERMALVGSLGLQIVLLGIAWSLMKFRERRGTYLLVFGVAAIFSIFFSYANFDTNLQEKTRTSSVRSKYTQNVREVLGEYSRTAKQAAMKGRYQVARLEKLLEMEEERGWATIVDEGSKDPYIQSIIDGARATIRSWEANQGSKYTQGQGRGIIVNYLESNLSQAKMNVEMIEAYTTEIDSINLALNSELPVSDQYDLANAAWATFPYNETALLTAQEIALPIPPNQAEYIEKPASSQEALKLVINDLAEMNHLALFSLLLAIAVDMIIIIMAFAGSHIVGGVDYIFDRLKEEASKTLDSLPLDDPEKLARALKTDVEKFKKASEYGLDVSKVLWEYKNAKRKFKSGKEGDIDESKSERQLEEF